MTLSLDDVRNKRFRMARKSGYEVLEVDEFVDEVERISPRMAWVVSTTRRSSSSHSRAKPITTVAATAKARLSHETKGTKPGIFAPQMS